MTNKFIRVINTISLTFEIFWGLSNFVYDFFLATVLFKLNRKILIPIQIINYFNDQYFFSLLVAI